MHFTGLSSLEYTSFRVSLLFTWKSCEIWLWMKKWTTCSPYSSKGQFLQKSSSGSACDRVWHQNTISDISIASWLLYTIYCYVRLPLLNLALPSPNGRGSMIFLCPKRLNSSITNAHFARDSCLNNI